MNSRIDAGIVAAAPLLQVEGLVKHFPVRRGILGRVSGTQPQTACDAPRWKVSTGLSIDCEPTMAPASIDSLRALGHRVETNPDAYMDYGSGQFIWKLSDDLEDGYVAASDSRRDGQAVGY